MSIDWRPFEDHDDVTDRQVAGLFERLRGAGGQVLDLGCGDGRILVPLAAAGISMIGVDDDPAALAAVRHQLGERGCSATLIRGDFLASIPETPNGLIAVLMLGNTFMQVVEINRAVALLHEIAKRLAPSGWFIIDDFPFDCWRDLAEGNWQEGISEDGSQQIIFRPGDSVFALRSGDDVDDENWSIQREDTIYRMWSMGELDLLSRVSGMSPPQRWEEARLIGMRRG